MGIGLAEALAELREELYQAQDAGAGQQFRFEVESAELELTVEFRKNGDGKVKVSVGAAGVEAGGGAESTKSHRLALTLNIRDEALGGTRAVIGRNAPEAAAAKTSGIPEVLAAGAAVSERETPMEEAGERPRRPWDR
ncbi:trypco2 family protein [Streptomyces sp. NPDC048685]|uniref:trypco2 family protein n=1 Tax=Streptomyces sp. NPDC048685 TaxID=3365584 RepID=UPI003715AB54